MSRLDFYFISDTLFRRAFYPSPAAKWEREREWEGRRPPSDAQRFTKMAAIRSILVQSWPSWALNDHKEEIFHLAPCSLMQKWLQMAQNALGRLSGEAGKEKRIKHGPFNQGFE